jgi:hypothetical protein
MTSGFETPELVLFCPPVMVFLLYVSVGKPVFGAS